MRVFLISGKAGCGKDEVAKLIKSKLDNTVITGLSKYIKLFALELTDWDGNDNNKPREFLQTMGDKLRACREDYLTKRVYEDIEVYKQEGISNVVVSDVRLVNEINYFKGKSDLEVITIRVNCNNSKRCLTDSEKCHITETELDNYNEYDYIVENKFNEELEKQINEILEGMK
jgi:phosphomevalonate kinase